MFSESNNFNKIKCWVRISLKWSILEEYSLSRVRALVFSHYWLPILFYSVPRLMNWKQFSKITKFWSSFGMFQNPWGITSEFHWLLIREQIHIFIFCFKIWVRFMFFVLKCLNKTTPRYLCNLFCITLLTFSSVHTWHHSIECWCKQSLVSKSFQSSWTIEFELFSSCH